MNVPTCAIPVLTMFRPAFSTPTYRRFLVLALAAVLTTGRRTIINLLRTVRSQAPGHMSTYHRVFSQRRWSTWALARILITCLLDYLVPAGPVFLAGDDTVTAHPGPHVFGKGRHRDGVRSTHGYTAYRWGHTWVVVAVLVQLPVATRPWALPILVAWSRPPQWDRVQGTRHKTPAHLVRRLLARLMRWFPERHFIFVGDTGYGTSATARCCRKHGRPLTLVSKFYGDAALYEPPPPRTRRPIGRPRVQGRKLASPQEVVTQLRHRSRLTGAWYGGTPRDIELVTGTGHWYRIGQDLVAVRWVYVHDATGTHRDEYLFTTDLQMPPKQLVECYTHRWSIETTFQACREYLKLESPKGDGQQTVLRFTPCLLGLYSIVVLRYLQLPEPLRSPLILWKGTLSVTFADMVTCARRELGQQWFFQTDQETTPFSKLPSLLQETILYALAPAA